MSDSSVAAVGGERERPAERYDVAILGGGLAGLTLAIQLKRTRPETRVLVAERRAHEAPEAAFKVGESSVECGAYYFHHVCGLFDHLVSEQLDKQGLRFYFPAGDNDDIARRVEWGTPTTDGVYTFQIDRGRFENELHRRATDLGADALLGWRVEQIEIGKGDKDHRIELSNDGDRATVVARWVVDAAGRASLLKSKLGLAQDNGHAINSAWFRLDGGLDLEQWSDNEEWLSRMPEPGLRRHATCHLMGEGYWVWLIQLASGPISIGVVADPAFHPFDRINTLEGMLEWLREHEPQVAAAVDGRRDDVKDFLKIEHFSHGCKQVYSADRWCLTGEAGPFLDPLFSPGSDYIGLGNTFVTDLVVRDLNGEAVVPTSWWSRFWTERFYALAKQAARSGKEPPKQIDLAKIVRRAARANRIGFYDMYLLSLYEGNLAVYRDNYGMFGDPQVMLPFVAYGTLIYWSFIANYFLHEKFTDIDFVTSTFPEWSRFGNFMPRLYAFLREWHERGTVEATDITVPEFAPLRARLADLAVPFDDDELREQIRKNTDVVFAIAVVLFHEAAKDLPEKPGEDVPINAMGISVDPQRWKKDGLFSPPGMTLAQARELVPDVDKLFIDRDRAELVAT